MFLVIGMIVAVAPLVSLALQNPERASANVPIGWIDYDNTAYSNLLQQNVQELSMVYIVHGEDQTLTADLKTGKLESIYIVHEGFESDILDGRF